MLPVPLSNSSILCPTIEWYTGWDGQEVKTYPPEGATATELSETPYPTWFSSTGYRLTWFRFSRAVIAEAHKALWDGLQLGCCHLCTEVIFMSCLVTWSSQGVTEDLSHTSQFTAHHSVSVRNAVFMQNIISATLASLKNWRTLESTSVAEISRV